LAISVTFLLGACQPTGTSGESGSAASNAASNNAPAKSADKTDQKAVVDEIKEVLAQHDKALSEKNLDSLMQTFSSDPNTAVLGTGAEEKWVGQQEIRSAYTEIFKDYDPNTLQSTCDWKTGGSDDDGMMAWLAAICSCKDSLQGKTREYKLNVSAALKKQDGKWRFAMLHMSNAFQPPVTK
jgi:ketosteroid isomerase-like protein